MNVPVRSIALVLLAAAGPGCRSELPYGWTDPVSKLDVRSDFPVSTTQYVFETELARPMAALRSLFAIETLSGLTLHLHDKSELQVDDDVAIAGWHQGDEIHAMAGWPAGLQLGFPSVESTSTVLHEFVHALVARSELHLPRWFEEGLCEVLSVSVPVDGELVWLPNGSRERSARRLLEQGSWLTADQLIAVVDDYPDDSRQLTALYAQATSFVWFLVADAPPTDRRAIEAVANQPEQHLRERFAAWQAALAKTTVTSLYAPFVADARFEVRDVAVDELGPPGEHEADWRLAEQLLTDPSPTVRAAMRIKVISRPATSPLARDHFQRWAASENADLRRSGQLALAQLGDVTAAVRFCRSFDADERDWAQPLLWLLMIAPDRNGARRAPAIDLMTGGLSVSHCATALADDLEALAERLSWDSAAGRFELR